MINKITIRKITSWCLPSLLLSFCLNAHSFESDKIVFQLDWLPGGDKAPIYVGIQKGFFAEQGIEVVISQGRGSTDSISKIASGTSNIGLTDLTALLMAKAQNDVPVSAVYNVFSQAAYAFFSLSDSGIDSVQDVSNKRIATSPFTSSNIFLPLLLTVNNIDEDSIQLIKADPGALNPMLIMGRVDVIISWITDSYKLMNQASEAGKKLNVMPWYEAGLNIYSTSLIVNDKFIEEHPELVKKFINAYAQSVEYTWSNVEESAQLVQKMVPELERSTIEQTITAIRHLVYNPSSEKNGVGSIDPERLAETWRWTAKAQKLDIDSFDPENAVNRSLETKVN